MIDIPTYFKQEGRVIHCVHVAEGTPHMNFEGISFNLGDVAFIPCERCVVAIRETVLVGIAVDALRGADYALAEEIKAIISQKLDTQ